MFEPLRSDDERRCQPTAIAARPDAEPVATDVTGASPTVVMNGAMEPLGAIKGFVSQQANPEPAMYELFQALLNTPWHEQPVADDAPIAPADAHVAPDLEKCFEAVEQQIFDQP